jgi:hypothetical protein
MKNTLHGDVNERMVVRVTTDLVAELRPELAAFLRQLQLGHLLDELIIPLTASARTTVAVAYEERPWPPAGVGAHAIRGIAMAVVSDDRQALLTPCLLSPRFATNVGLAAALTKTLLEALAGADVEWVSLFVNERSQVVASELAHAGFEPRAARVLTEGTEFVAFAAKPSAVLKRLGLAEMRMGDVLSLRVDRGQMSQLTAFHLSLSAGIANHWAGHTNVADVFPGIIDWVALPPGGITGTPGPGGPVDVDPVIIIPS